MRKYHAYCFWGAVLVAVATVVLAADDPASLQRILAGVGLALTLAILALATRE
jgi:hypothetical protein